MISMLWYMWLNESIIYILKVEKVDLLPGSVFGGSVNNRRSHPSLSRCQEITLNQSCQSLKLVMWIRTKMADSFDATKTGGQDVKMSSILILFLAGLYTLSFSICIPVYPSLLLELTHSSSKSSLVYGSVSCLRYLLVRLFSYFKLIFLHPLRLNQRLCNRNSFPLRIWVRWAIRLVAGPF